MRIAIFTDGFYPELGGIQDSVKALAEALGKRGNEVLCVVPTASPKDYALSRVPVGKELDLGPHVHIMRIPSLPMRGSGQQMRLVIPTFRIWRYVQSFHPDVIHTQTFFGLGFEALRAARKLHVPIVGTNHSAVGEFKVYAPFWPDRVGRWILKAVIAYYNRCDFVTGPSHSVLDEMAANGLRAPHEPVSNPIDTAIFHLRAPDERLALKRKHDFSNATFIYAGRFGVEKNIDVLLRALALIQKEVPEAVFALAGHGSDEARLRKLADELGVASSVRFLGTLSQPQLSEAFVASEVFVISSMSETQSMVLLQANACGIPAVGANWRSLPEYIPEGAGFLAQPRDHEDFARKITTLLKDAALRAAMGASAAQFASQFSPDDVAAHWERIYGNLISRSRSR